jgi:hypothetical protein
MKLTRIFRHFIKHGLRSPLSGLLIAGIVLLACAGFAAASGPVKVFILGGQSNMVGQGEMLPATTQGTLEYVVANDPTGFYRFISDGAGGWASRDDVWMRFEKDDTDIRNGNLTTGYGNATDEIGPELGFGHVIGDLYEHQVLLVKAAWGGKSLAVDFRPPSSGGTTGFYYNEILRVVADALDNIGTYFPDYDAAEGYEIAGFAWHQGWNDRVSTANSAEYETNLVNFIKDIRTDLAAPNLPFVIATTGMEKASNDTGYTEVELAQLAVADGATYPEFEGNVSVVDTRASYEGLDFWQSVADSPASQNYHWNRNAKTYVHIGLALGEEMSTMLLSESEGPQGYLWCADDGDSFTFSNTVNVAYGAEGQFNYLYGVTGLVTFNTTTFGDPVSGAANAGYYKIVDIDAPIPNPMSWATPPTATSSSEITMTATTATDANGVEYYFTCVIGDGHDSDWQSSANYTDTGLTPVTEYGYTVMARDFSKNTNTTTASETASATTPSMDLDYPTPNPMTWATAPAALSYSEIIMTATTATDTSGVEYYFTCTAGGGHDSDWQDSPIYTNTGLSAETSYSYTVMARDKSPEQNTTAASAEASATTQVAPEILYSDTFDDGDLADNTTGIGGGTSFDTRALGTPTETGGNLDMGRGAVHNNRGNTFSTQSFDLTGGFSLAVSYSALDVDAGRVSMGLVDAAVVAAADYNGYFADWISRDQNKYGIGMNLTPNDGATAQGLNFSDDTTTTSLCSIDFVDGAASFVLEVDADSNWSYSLNGGTAVTGTIAGGFDFTREYQFATFTQNLNNETGVTLDSVSLSPIKKINEIDDIGMDVLGSALGFSWHGEAGQTYSLEVTDDLTVDDWQTVTNVVGTNGLISLTGAMDQTNAFYRVKLAE